MDPGTGEKPNQAGDGAFDPYDLRPLASLNRRRVAALPGIDPAWAGQTGWELCSKATLIAHIQRQAPELGLADEPAEELPRRLNDLLAGVDGPARRAAAAIAAGHGRRLGGLLASLVISPQGLSTPLSDWEAAYLRHWREDVRTIVLGGGLANGRLGQEIAAAAQAQLGACGLARLSLRPAPAPSYLPLIGAARRLPPGPASAAALVDFGSTRAKRGLALYDRAGALSGLRVLEPLAIAGLGDAGRATEMAEAIAACLADMLRIAGPELELSPRVTASVAAYIRDNRPEAGPGRDGGAYALNRVSAHIAGWFSARISAACGRAVQFQFMHDGDAAAGAQSGEPHAAVLMLGTSLGVGFVPPAAGFRPLAKELKVEAV